MSRAIAVLVATVFLWPCSLFANYGVLDRGTWPESWPRELDSLRKQSHTLEGPLALLPHDAIPFTDCGRPSFWLGDASRACVCVHSPPQGEAPPEDARKAGVEKPVEPAATRKRDIVTAWGNEVGGLQAGLGVQPGEHRLYRRGEEVTLVVRVRNVGKEQVKFQYLSPYFKENWPTVTGAEGKPVPQPGKAFAGGTAHLPKEVSLPPGKETDLANVTYELRPPSDWATKNSTKHFPPLYGSGKVGLQYEKVFGDSSLTKIDVDPSLSTLATGKLELEIESAAPAASEKN